MESPTKYVLIAGLYLLGVIGGLVFGCHVGEAIGRHWERPIPGLLAGAGIGGTLGCLAMYAVVRWVLMGME
ncbi:MAG: hypothetical protein FJX74_12570 [Armatimonadetes bacterium]|nr:hypothetical protein [Armatimonadota bacterium]